MMEVLNHVEVCVYLEKEENEKKDLNKKQISIKPKDDEPKSERQKCVEKHDDENINNILN